MTPKSPDLNQNGHDAALKEELLALEKRYWKAMQDNDIETALSLTDYPCIIAGPSGVGSIDRDKFREIMRTRKHKIDDVYLDPDVHMRMLGDDTAVLAYTVHERLTVDGKTETLDAADASTWVRRGDRWLCALHTESALKPMDGSTDR